MKKIFILSILLVLLSSFTYAVDCNSCSDCNSKVAAASPGDTITLIQNVTLYDYTTCVSFASKNNIVFDGNGNFFKTTWTAGSDGRGGTGILVDTYSTNIEIKNVKLIHYLWGIFLQKPSNVYVHDNEIVDTSVGVFVQRSDNITVEGNFIHDSYQGIRVTGVNESEITENNIYDILNEGIVVTSFSSTPTRSSTGVTISYNTIVNATTGMSCGTEDNISIFRNNINDCTTGIAPGSYYHLYANNFYNNTYHVDVSLNFNSSLSYNNVGNFWNRTIEPCFVSSEDTYLNKGYDDYPSCTPFSTVPPYEGPNDPSVPEWSDLAYVLIVVGALAGMYSRREN